MSTRITTENTVYIEDSDVEVIEDSEPEREAQRNRDRAERKRIGANILLSHPPMAVRTTSMGPSTQDTSSSIVSSKPPASSTNVLLTLSNHADRFNLASQALSLPASTSSAPTRRIAPPPWLASKDTPILESPGSPKRQLHVRSSSQPSPVKQLDLNSFAFQKRVKGARSVSSRSVSSSKRTDVEDSSALKSSTTLSSRRSTSKSFCLAATRGFSGVDATFSPDQITSLMSCVVCGNSWTVRKRADSKWSHITACARKHHHAGETLHMKLVTAIAEAAEEKERKAKKGKEKEPVGPQSLLAHTVQERAPAKRRGRRKEPGPSSLLPVEEAQRSILQKSIALLDPDLLRPDKSESQSQLSEQRARSSEEPAEIPATQTFAPSKMGGGSKFFGSNTGTFNKDSTSGLLYVDEPRSLLSGFRDASPSSLSVASIQSMPLILSSPRRPSVDSSIISIHSSSSEKPLILSNRVPSPARSDSSASVLIIDSSLQKSANVASPALDTQFDLVSDDEEWNSQEGVYMWEDYVGRAVSPTDALTEGLLGLTIQEPRDDEPRGRSQSPRRLMAASHQFIRPPDETDPMPSSLNAPPSLETSNRSHSTASDRPLAAVNSVAAKVKGKKKQPASPPPKKRAKKKAVATHASEEGDGTPSRDLDSELLAMIKNDKTLYLRILRYEPIKFEDLLDMAVATGVPNRGLPAKLKSFLDSQCINFYSGDNLGRRKRH